MEHYRGSVAFIFFSSPFFPSAKAGIKKDVDIVSENKV
jgi:hypothetical protein